jgi:uncharacterized protein YdhG (YjbR/CyaY superfamily)
MPSADVDAYLAGVPEPQRATLETVRRRLRDELPDAEEAISYGVPAFKVDGVAVAGYAPAKNHCSYFPMSGSVLAAMAAELSGFDWSKGTLRFPIDQPLSEDLIHGLVQVRLAEIAASG